MTKTDETFYKERLLRRIATEQALRTEVLKGGGFSLYYGTGLATPRATSVGVPFDILIPILVAEKIRRYFDGDIIYHHIADTHALTNDFCTQDEIAKLAQQYKTVIRSVAKIVHAPIKVVLASSIDKTKAYQKILGSIETQKGAYVQRELADMLWYRGRRNVRLKLGWLISEKRVKEGFDERLFDQEFARACDGNFSFAYTVPGRTFDRARQRVSPYVSIPGEQRILIQQGERVREKYERAVVVWGNADMGGILGHLGNILNLWSELGGPTISQDGILEGVQSVIDMISNAR